MSELAGYGGGVKPQTMAGAAMPTFNGHINELDVATKRLYEHLQHLTLIADRLSGSRPEPVDRAGNPEPPVTAIMLGLQRRTRDLNAVINAIMEQTGRIDSVLGDNTARG